MLRALARIDLAASERNAARLCARLSGDTTLFLLVFRDERLTGPEPATDAERKAALANVFADVGWEWPRIREAMAGVEGVYFEAVGDDKPEVRIVPGRMVEPRYRVGRLAARGEPAS